MRTMYIDRIDNLAHDILFILYLAQDGQTQYNIAILGMVRLFLTTPLGGEKVGWKNRL